MLRKRIITLLLALCCLLGLSGAAMALEVDCDSAYCFSPADFPQEEALAGICILELPDPDTGTLLLGSRVLRSGDILTADQLAQMTFAPLQTEADAEASVTYLPIYDSRVDREATMTISIRGKEDKSPVAEDSVMETYKNLPNEARLKVTDPEGKALTYTVTRQPKRGSVIVREDGSFLYTPKKNKVGVDSFTYTATDPAGNVSREATVTIQIMKPTAQTMYTDTVGADCRFAAEWMKNTGLFVGEQVGGESCFRPDAQVSRGEFLTMVMGVLDIPAEETAVSSAYTDGAPDWLKPYMAAALRSGLLTGIPVSETGVFDAEAPITGAEAAVILQNAMALNVPEETASAQEVSADEATVKEVAAKEVSAKEIVVKDAAVLAVSADGQSFAGTFGLSSDRPSGEMDNAADADAGEENTVPAWAETSLRAMDGAGIVLAANASLTRGEVANILYQVSLLAPTAPGTAIFRVQ